MIGKEVTVVIDRPTGSAHPVHPDIVYPINYGYIPGIIASDGECQDAYILGVEEPISEFTGIVIAIVHRLNDTEDKWVVAPSGHRYTRTEIADQIHFMEQYFTSEIYFAPNIH